MSNTGGTSRRRGRAMAQRSPARVPRACCPRFRLPAWARRPGHADRRGVSLIELMVVLVIMGVLLAVATPTFRRSIEQSHADIAAANLRSIWTAQRLYWLENRSYTNDLTELESLDLVAPAIVSAAQPFAYSLSTDAEGTTFTAMALRSESTVWSGSFEIDQTGTITGTVYGSGGIAIEPGFLD